jgi:hypothetical protein
VQPALDGSDLESRLGWLVRLSAEVSSEPTIEPHVTLAHDPRDPRALLGQVNRGNAVRPNRSAEFNQVPSRKQFAGRGLSSRIDEPRQPNESDPFDWRSLLSFKQS